MLTKILLLGSFRAMLNKIKYKKIANLLWTVFLLFLVFLIFGNKDFVYGVSSLQINFSGKIVTSEGLDISYDPPGCISSVGADTCDFQIKFYNHQSDGGAPLLGSEIFEDVEINDYRGYFNLKIGGGSYTAGEYPSIKEIFLNETDVYIEVLFDGSGESDFNFENDDLERFVVSHDPLKRMAVGTSPYAIGARGAIDEFQLKVKTGGVGTSEGLIYFDGAEKVVKVYDGTQWQSLVYNVLGVDALALGKSEPDSGFVFDVLGDSKFSGRVLNNISNDNLPEVLGGSDDDLSASTNFYLSDNYAFVVKDGTPASLAIYDVGSSRDPTLINSAIPLTGFDDVYDIKVLGSYAYILADDSVVILDISDVNEVEILSSEDVAGASESAILLEIQGRYGYITTSESLLVILDLSSTNPKVLGSVDIGEIDVVGLEVVGKYAYVLAENSLVVVDIVDEDNPIIVDEEEGLSFSSATSFSVSGRYGYITTASAFYVIDLLDPESITDVSNIALGVGDASSVLVSGNNAFVLVASSPSSLLTLDISDVNNLELFDAVFAPSGYNNARVLRVGGKYGYALTDGGLAVFDLKGIETSALFANTFGAFSGTIYDNLSVHRDLSISGGMHVGRGGIYSGGSLVVDGLVRIVEGLGVGTGESVYINQDGYLVAGSSSLRYKNDVQEYGSVLSKLSNLDLVRFTWGESSMSYGESDIGMIAEEVAKYLPELVNFNVFGQPESLKYDRMGAYAIAGINELKAEFDEFKGTVLGAQTEQIVYTSELEFEVGSLVSRDFSRENSLFAFEEGHIPLYGIVTEVLDYEEGGTEGEGEDEEEENNEENGEELTLFEYKITSYSGAGEYEILVHRKADEKSKIFEAGTPIYIEANGEVFLPVEEDSVSGLLIGYLVDALEFDNNSYSTLTNVYLTYTPLNFGSVSLSSLFNSNPDDDRLTLGGGHINFSGYRGSFDFLETKMLNVDNRIIILVEDDEPQIKIDGVNLIRRVSELEKKLNEYEDAD